MKIENVINIDIEASYGVNPYIYTDKEIADYIRKEIDNYNEKEREKVKELLETSILTKTLITLVNNQYRGFGKTRALIEKAEELNATLIVPRILKQYYIDYLPESQIKCYVSPEQVRGLILPNGFLVDEGVDPKVIKELSRYNKFLGGFNRL